VSYRGSPKQRDNPAPARNHQSGAEHPDPLRIGRIPIAFFVVAVLFFAGGLVELCFSVRQIAIYFYQFVPLAVVHTFTLGWITGSIMGVMYRYVPALTHRPIRWPWMAWGQLFLFVLGSTGMVAHFEIGIWFGLWLAAIVMAASILMFAANLVPCLWPEAGRGVAETGMLLSISFLVAAAVLGTMLGIDKSYNFLGGGVLTNLSGHVHLAAVGWVTLSICAVSYRMLPAFMLPTVTIPRSAIWQIYALAAALVGLTASVMLGLGGELIWGLAIAAAMGWYVAIISRMVRTRRMPLDWTQIHALAGLVALVATIGMGLALIVFGVNSQPGARLATAYGVIGLLGFFSNFIMGMSYQLFPGFVTRARQGLGWKPVTIAEISVRKPRPFVFVTFNGGVLAMAAGFGVGEFPVALAGAIAAAVGGLVYCTAILWTLGFALRRALPRSAAQASLRVMPD
jgi:hypothetical protein